LTLHGNGNIIAAMKRSCAAVALLLAAAIASFGQSLGFGANGAAGSAFQGGDPAEIARRIMSATRYKCTPGDTYLLSITNESVVSYSLALQENYDIEVPNMGTLNVKGMYFADLRKLVTDRIKKLYPQSPFVSLVLQSPARFDVAVFGGVLTPGIVTMYPLARVSDAITLAGRFKPGASYRRISLIRAEQKITVDLMRYSVDGASEQNPYLEPGDRIYVPQAEVTVTLSGQVKYPGVFELVSGETLQTLIEYAGGPLPDARAEAVSIVRFGADGAASQSIVNLAGAAGQALANGDQIRVPSLVENRQMILVTGAVFGAPVATDKPVQIPLAPISVNVPYTPGLSLVAVLQALGGPTPYARAKESLLIRKQSGERVPVDIEALWASRDPAKDILLEPGDTLSIPMANEVYIAGEVRIAGKLPFNPSMTVADYLVASGGINPDTADPNGIWFVDRKGGRTRALMTSSVEPGILILVEPNSWTNTQKAFANITVVTTFATAIITFATTLISFVRLFVP
jgi:protein involved in polysaccharide export with SLBB domain